MKVNSSIIKYNLLYYYKFKRGFLCADEVNLWNMGIADVLADNGKEIHEIEVKINKYDLINLESKKRKHQSDRNISRFYICVPTNLIDKAKNFVNKINKNYGIIEFREDTECDNERIRVIKRAKKLNKFYNNKLRENIINRLNNSLITRMGKLVKK